MVSLQDLRDKLNYERKSGNKLAISILSTLIGELTANAKMVDGEKVVSNEEVVAHLKKHIKKLHETIALKNKQKPSAAILIEEAESIYVSQFLPVMLTEAELHMLIKEHNFADLKSYMAYLKANHNGLYDGKVASETFKRFMQIE